VVFKRNAKLLCTIEDVLTVHGAGKGFVLHLFLYRGDVYFEDAAVRFDVRDGGDEAGQFVAGEESPLERRDARHAGVLRVGEDGAAYLFGDSAFGQYGFALLRVLFERRVDLPIEIVEQGSDGPESGIAAKFGGVGGDASFDGEGVLAESVGLGEFAEKVPGLGAGEHRHHDIATGFELRATRPSRRTV